MYISTSTITSKGQLSLPKQVRDVIGSRMVSIEINDAGQVLLSPVANVSGALSEYKNNSDISFNDIRQESWVKFCLQDRYKME